MALRFHLKASPSLLVRAGQHSQGAHLAARMPLGAPGRLRHGRKRIRASQQASSLAGLWSFLAATQALEALGYNTPPLPGAESKASRPFSSPWVSCRLIYGQRGIVIFQRLTAQL